VSLAIPSVPALARVPLPLTIEKNHTMIIPSGLCYDTIIIIAFICFQHLSPTTGSLKTAVLSNLWFTAVGRKTARAFAKTDRLLQRLYIKTHYQEHIDTRILEKEIYYSYRYLSKHFYKEMNMTPIQYKDKQDTPETS
jgi:AraC-like DNA-binding protein